MSDGDRDRGPEGKTATQDPYARAADSNAARSRTGQGSNGARNGSAASAGAGASGGAGVSGGVGGAHGPTGSNGTNGSTGSNGSGSAHGQTPASAAAVPSTEPKPTTQPTADGPGLVQTWRQKLGALTQRVMGSDETTATTASTKAPTSRSGYAAAAKATSPAGQGSSAKNGPTTDKGAHEPTAVVALPAAAAGAATAARVTGTRPAPGAPAPTTASTAETLDTTKHKAGTPRRTRKARLRLSRLDPWSVMKTAFMFSIAGGIMLVVGVYALWTVISSSGLFDSVNEIIAAVVSTPGDTTPFRVEDYVNTAKVMGVTAFLACIDVVIFTALATLFSFLYNLAATMLGGLEITLAED